MLQRTHWLAIGIIAALALFSLLTLGQRSVAADEFSMFWAAPKSIPTILKLYFSPYENNPAGTSLLQHAWGSLFGFSDESLRMLALIFALGAVAYIWKLTNLFAGQLTDNIRLAVFGLAATTPVVWMGANFARYQSVVMLLGLAAVYYYSLWYKAQESGQSSWRNLALYVVLTGATFYFHYLSAAVFALCAGLHYLSTLRKRSLRQIGVWAASQALIIVLILPIVITILTTYSQMDLGASPLAATNVKKPVAAVMFFGATVFGLMNGFAVAPWTVWVVLPMLVLIVVLSVLAFRTEWIARNRFGLFFLAFPLVFMSLVVVRMYPPLQFYLIPSVQRVGFVAPLFWIVVGMGIAKITKRELRIGVVVSIMLCNFYAIATWNLNAVATQQTPPIREVRDFVGAHVKDASRLTVAHPFGYRYGMESVGSATSGSATAVDRYLPTSNALFWVETDLTNELTLDSCERFATAAQTPEFVIVQRNRYHTNSDRLAEALQRLGYKLEAEQPLQRQTAFDVWFKAQLLKLPMAGFKEDAAPQQYLYMVRYFRKS